MKKLCRSPNNIALKDGLSKKFYYVCPIYLWNKDSHKEFRQRRRLYTFSPSSMEATFPSTQKDFRRLKISFDDSLWEKIFLFYLHGFLRLSFVLCRKFGRRCCAGLLLSWVWPRPPPAWHLKGPNIMMGNGGFPFGSRFGTFLASGNFFPNKF